MTITEKYRTWLIEQEELEEYQNWLEEGKWRNAAITAAGVATVASGISATTPPKHELQQTRQHIMRTSYPTTDAVNDYIKKRGHHFHIGVLPTGHIAYNPINKHGQWWTEGGSPTSNRIKKKVSNTPGASKEEWKKNRFNELKSKWDRNREDHDLRHGEGSYRKLQLKKLNKRQSRLRVKL